MFCLRIDLVKSLVDRDDSRSPLFFDFSLTPRADLGEILLLSEHLTVTDGPDHLTGVEALFFLLLSLLIMVLVFQTLGLGSFYFLKPRRLVLFEHILALLLLG
jgi:hypothetical protein